ncbi:hypothetical protein LguiB_029699 [Lonicera macranthoides]
MSSIMCSDQKQFRTSHQLFHSPPRKLLTRRSISPETTDFLTIDSPRADFAKFLPRNSPAGDEESDDPYSSDHFRIYEFKVRRCTRSRSHDWTDCPFAHPGEKARRRDPRRYRYSGAVCPDFRRGNCSKGDNCDFAHGVFEHWLHPARYRTEACKDGKNCQRKICFFAHTSRQLRVLPPNCYENTSSPVNSPLSNERINSPIFEEKNYSPNHCCVHCRHNSFAGSPTSPLSPVKSRPVTRFSSPISRFGDGIVHRVATGEMSYSDGLTELANSLEEIKFNEGIHNQSFVDVYGDDQFIMSPSTVSSSVSGGRRRSFADESFLVGHDLDHDLDLELDLGWVNDLLT